MPQEVIVLRGGVFPYTTQDGTALDPFHVDVLGWIEVLQKYVGQPLASLGRFNGIDPHTIVRQLLVKDGNLVALIDAEGEHPTALEILQAREASRLAAQAYSTGPVHQERHLMAALQRQAQAAAQAAETPAAE